MIIERWYFPRKVTISEPNCKFLRVCESCTDDLNLSAALARPALRINLIHTDRRVKQCAVVVCEHICENAILSVADNFSRRNFDVALSMADEAFAPRVRFASLVNSVC
jgi:hypothetical protein